MQNIKDCDVFISTAAVTDYYVSNVSSQKIKKAKDNVELRLVRNPDILLEVSKLNPRPILIGFAAETENLVEHAKQKLHEKRLDMIFANLVGENRGFQSDYNEIVFISNDTVQPLPNGSKKNLAREIINILINHLADTPKLSSILPMI